MAHNLFLGMYTFQIKKMYSSNLEIVENNDYLSRAYPKSSNKFIEGFVQDFISLIDNKTFKNEQNTHGAILEEKSIDNAHRTLDVLIDGGLTGIKQFIIDESGKKRILSEKETVGLKFYARIWLPANTKTGYLFIQKYGSLSIKPIFDSILQNIFNKHNYNLVGNRVIPTTTQTRQKDFLKYSKIKDIVIVSNNSSHETGAADATSATIKLKNVVTKNRKNVIDDLPAMLKNHGFSISDRRYEIKATYLQTADDYKEEKTVILDSSEETINVIPNIVIPKSCIDVDNYPIFIKMQDFVDGEMKQIKKEAKM